MITQIIEKYKKNKSFQEFVRFCIVGGICTILDACIFYVVRLFAPYQVALTSGYCLSLIVNYFLTIYWTFKKKASAKNALGVIGAHLFNLFVVRMGLMFIFVDCLGIDDKIAYVPTLLISMVTNFIVVKFVVNKFSTACVTICFCSMMNSCTTKQTFDPNLYIYLCFGQSNMVGLNEPDAQDSIVSSRLLYLASCDDCDRELGKWYPALPPLCKNKAGICPADYFGRTMLDVLPEKNRVGLIVVAVNGVSILAFDKNKSLDYYNNVPENWMKRELCVFDKNLYNRLLSLAQEAQKKGVIKGIIMHQGETDAIGDEWCKNVETVYRDLLDDLHLSADSVPLLVGEAVGSDQDGSYQHVNYTIDRIHDFIPTAYTISSKGCKSNPDHLHFSTEGQRRLGKRYGIRMLQLMGYDIPNDTDNELQIASSPKEEAFAVNIHYRTTDNRLLIASTEPIKSVNIFSFSGENIKNLDLQSAQTTEIDLDSLSNEKRLVLNITSSTGLVVSKHFNQ